MRAGVITIASTCAILSVAVGIASAQDTTATGGTTSASGSGGSGDGSSSLVLKAEDAAPPKSFFFGKRPVVYRYTVDGDRPRNLKIQAVRRSNWRVVKVWRRDDVEPGTYKVRWGGRTRNGGAARKGAYLFRVRTKHGANVDRTRSKGDNRSFRLYPQKFPVRGRHTYGDGFGAPRSGHTHQGQDVFAKCGKRMVAARGGRVQYRGNDPGGGGYYLVIDGRSEGHDYVYMHLQGRGRPKQGARVRTGQRIGYVGQSGNASGCHLHFEVWSRPGWYEGGHPMRAVTKFLKRWDRWS